MEHHENKLFAVVGPTASGKTGLAVELALLFNGEIISCDSMQIYRSMPIATAVPDMAERKGIKHHLMEFLEPECSFSVKEYCELARKCIGDVISVGKMPILCGGTGLYYSSLTEGLRFSEGGELPELRAQLTLLAEEHGGEPLLERLASFDPDTAQRLNSGDIKRIIRAIEVYEATGITISESIRRSRLAPPDFELTAIGLIFAERQLLYERINKRVDQMMSNGLLEEARAYYSKDPRGCSAQAIGYKELRPYINGELSLDSALEKLKMETRRYAKRQITWFRRDKRIHWLNVDECGESLVERAAAIVREGIDGR